MARYLINYDNGMSAPIIADKVAMNVDDSEYRFLDGNDRIVAYVRAINVLSIVLADEPQAVTD